MPTETERYGQIYLYDCDEIEKNFSFYSSIPQFTRAFKEITDLYNFGFIYEEEHIKSKFKTKNKAILNNE